MAPRWKWTTSPLYFAPLELEDLFVDRSQLALELLDSICRLGESRLLPQMEDPAHLFMVNVQLEERVFRLSCQGWINAVDSVATM